MSVRSKLVFVFNSLELVATSFFVMHDFLCVACLGYLNYFATRLSTEATNPNNAKVCPKKK